MIDLLAELPWAGQLSSAAGIRRVIAAPYPYLGFDQVGDHEEVMIGVRHGARDTPPP